MIAKTERGRPADGGEEVWDPSSSYLRVVLRDVVTEAKVGLHPWERHPERLTRLVVNAEMFVPFGGRPREEHPGAFVDYDRIRDALKAWPSREHTPLLETLLDEVVGLCFESARVSACRVSVVKPDIFNEAAGVGVEAYVLRADYLGAGAE